MAETVENEPVSCFTYEVTMLVHIFAKDKEEADTRLNNEGGFVSRRSVDLKDFVNLYSGDEKPE